MFRKECTKIFWGTYNVKFKSYLIETNSTVISDLRPISVSPTRFLRRFVCP